MTLLAMQQDFSAWLRDTDEDAATRMMLASGPGLQVYQNNYRSQLMACLDESFPQTRKWLGDREFHAAMATHIDDFPPNSWTLDAYARDVPASLAVLYADDPEVGELAWLELALGEAFVGPDATALTVAEAASVDWDHATLAFVPTLDCRTAITNAPAIWTALVAEEAPPPATILDYPGAIIVWRSGHVSRFRAIDLEERDALAAASGNRFSSWCETLVDRLGQDTGVQRAGGLLGQWLPTN